MNTKCYNNINQYCQQLKCVIKSFVHATKDLDQSISKITQVDAY